MELLSEERSGKEGREEGKAVLRWVSGTFGESLGLAHFTDLPWYSFSQLQGFLHPSSRLCPLPRSILDAAPHSLAPVPSLALLYNHRGGRNNFRKGLLPRSD